MGVTVRWLNDVPRAWVGIIIALLTLTVGAHGDDKPILAIETGGHKGDGRIRARGRSG